MSPNMNNSFKDASATASPSNYLSPSDSLIDILLEASRPHDTLPAPPAEEDELVVPRMMIPLLPMSNQRMTERTQNLQDTLTTVIGILEDTSSFHPRHRCAVVSRRSALLRNYKKERGSKGGPTKKQ
ncbi:unnamed protein product [Cylindrotheca closterium]|uniref:Uncharacterized protein n=1 Tax=Cylindrotheca closterium TaxID=2856 RepID=A0AAD2G2Q1_9STRA|nr:unnamed protein product [Cylindrotheca closterium]